MEEGKTQGSAASRWWPGIRLAIVALAIAGFGRVCSQSYGLQTRAFAEMCIVGGFFSVTVLAAIRLAVPSLRRGLVNGPVRVALLCVLLLMVQTLEATGSFEGHSHGGSRPFGRWARRFDPNSPGLGRHVNRVLSTLDRGMNEAGWRGEHLFSWLAVQALAYLAISRLWTMRARELAVGSALFWVWSMAYLLMDIKNRSVIDFWGQLCET
jgi:hypothetical protein